MLPVLSVLPVLLPVLLPGEEKPSPLAANFMLEQANISGTGRVDKDEWMAYSERLNGADDDLVVYQLTALEARLVRDNKRALVSISTFLVFSSSAFSN